MEKIILDQKDFIGKGLHKKTFLYPSDPQKCIKVAYSSDGSVDLLREIDYRKLRDKQGLKSKMLPLYYGKAITDMGEGFIFERIIDFDGKNSRTLQDFLENKQLLEENLEMICNVMAIFKSLLFSEELLTMGIFPENILIQKVGDNAYFPRVINDMGCANFIKLDYYFKYFRKKR